ncbi:Bacterial extracellular solute-binding protein, family 3 [Pseudodesulfovibrio hydrargyri]|uniref:Bacterial extracellular solute-binding protein, family 3 n=1 Tax=Pseudodesulfovibrio hydrargyri TaxID=2125990 RepID=A0A1J5NAV7_9BACT|nr:transporter substrate-binding domain-containing protein [Pseudodesulfovibrio hydrargyri]OIQ50359.1 Bacterial extracellular solute-binding protein, family 3 [Pseudodesulfovibrio hydrargyri]
MRSVPHTTPRFGAMTGFVLSVAAVAALCLAFALSCPARSPYRIGYNPGALVSVEAKNRLAAVYERAGLPVEFVPMPEKRSLYLAAEGALDGDAGRVAGLESRFPAMVRVNVKLMDFCGAAYVLAGRDDVGGYREGMLKGMKVGSLYGIVWADKIMKGRFLEQVTSYDALFSMLLEGRIDIVLCSRSGAEKAIAAHPGRYGGIRQLEPLVYREPFYHYLHRNNADIVPRLEKALRELHAEEHWRELDGN